MVLVDKILNLPFPILNHWGYWIILLGTILESNPITGLFIPGMSLVILGGLFAKIGILDIGDTLIIASIGAILGDILSYLLGKKYGYPFMTKYGKYFFFKREFFEKTKRIMNNHTGKTLIIGRFNSLTRAFSPFVAGSSEVPFMRFLAYDVLGCISWTFLLVMGGYAFGKSYEIASKHVGRFIFFAIVISILFILIYRFINKRKHIFSRYHLYTLILNIFSLYLFSKMIEDFISGELVTKLDLWINTKIAFVPVAIKLMAFIAGFASPTNLFILCMILFVFLLYKKKWYYSLLLLFGSIGALLLELIVSSIIHRARPANALVQIAGFSMPSLHATIAVIFFVLFAYAFKDDIKRRYAKNIFIIADIIMFLLVSLSTLFLNASWFSDIIAGMSLGLFWLTFLVLLFKIIISLTKKTITSTRKLSWLKSFNK